MCVDNHLLPGHSPLLPSSPLQLMIYHALLPQQSTWGQCDKQTWPPHTFIIADYEEEEMEEEGCVGRAMEEPQNE